MSVSPSGVVRVPSATPSVKLTATSGGQHPLYTHISVSTVDDSSRAAVPKEGESTGRHTDAAIETSAPLSIVAKSGGALSSNAHTARYASVLDKSTMSMPIRPSGPRWPKKLKIGSWNVEGLNEGK